MKNVLFGIVLILGNILGAGLLAYILAVILGRV